MPLVTSLQAKHNILFQLGLLSVGASLALPSYLRTHRACIPPNSMAIPSHSCPKQFWLMKSEPDAAMRDGIDLGSWPYSRLASVESEPFDGVRNFQARNYLRDHVRAGDMVFYYHSSCKKPGIYGISEICGPSYPDPTALEEKHPLFDPKHTTADPRWYTVDLKAVRALNPPVLLHTLKATPELSDMVLRRQPRLSVQPVTEKEWDTVLALADMTAKKTVTLNLDGVSESNGNDLKTSEQPASPALSPFSSLTVAELKDLLRAASLSQQGKKAELVSRLLAHGSSGRIPKN